MSKRGEFYSFECSICHTKYPTLKEAENCESRPVSQDRGVKVGDLVRVTMGDGKGQLAKVTKTFVYSKDWGHYAWERYWHTVGITADLIESWGSRQLAFDSYEVP